MMRNTLLIWLFLLPLPLAAQEFLDLPADVRGAGMGCAGVAMPAGAHAFGENAAAALFAGGRGQAGVSHVPWMRRVAKGYSLTAAGGFVRFGGRHALTAGMRFYREPGITILAPEDKWEGDYPFVPKDEENNPLADLYKDFRPRNAAFTVGYAYRLATHWGVSFSAGYAQSTLGGYGKAQALYADVAVTGRLPVAWGDSAFVQVGARLANAGNSWNKNMYELPLQVEAGGALQVMWDRGHAALWQVEAGYGFAPQPVRAFRVAVGAEYAYRERWFVRAGGHFGGAYAFATLGAGVRVWRVRVDAAYWQAAASVPLCGTCSFGVSFSF